MQQLARRWQTTLQLTELDDPSRLLNSLDGAVIVYLPPAAAGQELQLADARRDCRTDAMDRRLRGHPFTCAIFHWVPPGRYMLRWPSVGRERTVAVTAGQLVQVDWRRNPAHPHR